MNQLTQRNYHLDAIRALAAFVVVFTHLRAVFFIPFSDAQRTFLVNVIYIQHYLARGAVMCFFVLSGYLVGNSVLGDIKSNRWSWRAYLVRRLTRLQIVLMPALVLTAVLDFAGARISNSYAAVQADYTWKNFAGCLVFLQQVVKGVEPFGSNGPLWSLSYEFWYYILFPIAALIILKRGSRLALIPLLAAIVWLTFGAVLFLFSCWLAGLAAGHLAKRYPLRRAMRGLAVLISGLGFLVVTIACGAHRLDLDLADYLYGVSAVLLVWACLCMPLRLPSPGYTRTIVLLSEFSYTLYLTHSPFLLFLKAVWLGSANWMPDYRHVLLSVVPFIASLLFAYGCYLVFESNTDKVRKFVNRRIDQFLKQERMDKFELEKDHG